MEIQQTGVQTLIVIPDLESRERHKTQLSYRTLTKSYIALRFSDLTWLVARWMTRERRGGSQSLAPALKFMVGGAEEDTHRSVSPALLNAGQGPKFMDVFCQFFPDPLKMGRQHNLQRRKMEKNQKKKHIL